MKREHAFMGHAFALMGVLVIAAQTECIAATAAADPVQTPTASPPQAPGAAADERALTALLDARDDAGISVVTEADRRYLDGLSAHTRALIATAVGDERISSARHLHQILATTMSAEQIELAMGDNCLLCHSDPEVQSEDTLFSFQDEAASAHMALEQVVGDVHFRRSLSCAGCHGGDPTEPMGHDFVDVWPQSAKARAEDRAWVPPFCARCHSDSAYMRRFAPSLPTDQLDKYKQSRHGDLVLRARDFRAAECVSCHGVHGIQAATSPLSKVNAKRVPDTCAACHSDPVRMAIYHRPDGSPFPTNQLEQYRTSVHGRALLERGDIGAPACNDCHGNHAAMPPEVASVAQICRTCHARNGMLFDGSKHKIAFEAHGWPECGVCHGNHSIHATSDAMLQGPQSSCADCHARYASENPQCNATAAFFHDELTALASAHVDAEKVVDEIARRGLDAEPIHDEVGKLYDSLKQSRSYVHSFDRSEFAQIADQGKESIANIDAMVRQADGELRYRRRGLAVAVTTIALLILLLALKLRSIERRGL